MFLFSIVPIPLNSGNDSNIKNSVDKAQDRVLDLEALLTAAMLEQPLFSDNGDTIPYPEITDVNFSDGINKEEMQKIRDELFKARSEEKNLRNSGEKNIDLVNEMNRLSEVAGKISASDARSRDLEALLISPPFGIDVISGVDNYDPIAITAEIEKNKVYKKELQESEKYWKEVINDFIKEEDKKPTVIGDIQKEQMFRGNDETFGMVGIERIIDLYNLMYSLIEQKPLLDPNGNPDPNRIIPGVDNADANMIRFEMSKIQAHLLMNLKKASDEQWFGELKDVAVKRNLEIDQEIKSAQKKASELQKHLDTNEERREFYQTRAHEGELRTEQEFLKKIIEYKPAVTEHDNDFGRFNNPKDLLNTYLHQLTRAEAVGAPFIEITEKQLLNALKAVTGLKLNNSRIIAIKDFAAYITKSNQENDRWHGGTCPDVNGDGKGNVQDLIQVYQTGKFNPPVDAAYKKLVARLITNGSTFTKDDVTLLIKALADQNTLVRGSAAVALGNIGPDAKAAVPELIKALADEDIVMRRVAAEALGRIGPEAKAAIPELIKVLADEDEVVRRNAAEVLGAFGPDAKAAVETLKRLAQNDPNDSVKQVAKEALAKIEGKKADPTLPPPSIKTLRENVKRLVDNLQYLRSHRAGSKTIDRARKELRVAQLELHLAVLIAVKANPRAINDKRNQLDAAKLALKISNGWLGPPEKLH